MSTTMAQSDPDGFLEQVKGYVPTRDLSFLPNSKSGNPYSRIEPESEHRKFCAQSHYERAKEKGKAGIIPPNSDQIRKVHECDCCGKDSWRTDDDACGRCGEPMFDCPKCGEEVHGQPDECPECGASYNWN